MKNGKLSIYQEAISIQKAYSEKVILRRLKKNSIQLIAGTDVSYSRIGKETTAVAGIVIMEYGTWNVVEKVYSVKNITFSCISGVL